MEAYDETIDYKDLLTKYIKYRFKNWISAPRNAKYYPWLIDYDIMFEYKTHLVNLGYGKMASELYITGDIACVAGGAKIEDESTNKTFYKLFGRIFDYGFILQTVHGDSRSNRVIYNFYNGTVKDLIYLLGSIS